MYVLLTIFSGVTIVVSIAFLANLNNRVGVYQTTLVNFLGSVIFSGVILLFTKQFDWGCLATVPIYVYSGAIFAILVTMLNSVIITKISAVYTVILVFVGQLSAGLFIDFYQSGIIPIGDAIGGIIVIIGLLYNIGVDRDSEKKY